MARTPDSLIDTLVRADFVGGSADAETLRSDLDAILGRYLGIGVSGATSISGFVMVDESSGLAEAVLIEGVDDEPSGEDMGEYRGVTLRKLPNLPGVSATLDGTIVIGGEAAVRATIDAHGGHVPRLSAAKRFSSEFDALGKDAVVGAVIDMKVLGEALGRFGGPGLDTAVATWGPGGLRGVLIGEPRLIELTAGTIRDQISVMPMVADEISEELAPRGLTAEIATALAKHHAKRIADATTIRAEGGRLTVNLPLDLGDPSVHAAALALFGASWSAALVSHERREAADEARRELDNMMNALRDSYTRDGRCPDGGAAEGSAGVTPPLSLECGMSYRCWSTEHPREDSPHRYPAAIWTDNPVWSTLGFAVRSGHNFHYDFEFANATDEGCTFKASAFADLDRDGVYSTYQYVGDIKKGRGVRHDSLTIDNPEE